jgi:hypothetical protein
MHLLYYRMNNTGVRALPTLLPKNNVGAIPGTKWGLEPVKKSIL